MKKTPSLCGAPKFKVALCPHHDCGLIQVSESKHALTCKRCGWSTVFRKAGGWNVKVFHMTNDPTEAARFCIETKKNLSFKPFKDAQERGK